MDRIKLSQRRFGLMLIVLLLLIGCTPKTPSVTGTLSPWTASTPIAERKLVLCKAPFDDQAVDQPVGCLLTETVAISNEEGVYNFYDIPEGTYFLIYDSGIGDFEATVKEWAGKTLEIGNSVWLSEFLDLESNTWARLYLPAGFKMGMGYEEWNQEYVGLTLQFGPSPFVMAHDISKAVEERVVYYHLIDVVEGETFQADITVVYNKE
jgi:hypothetical protein